MVQKINIAELLKDCPQGMELYSPIFGEVYLDKIRPHLAIVVTTNKEQGDCKEEFLYDGRYGMNGECMLFPSKSKTTWEGFVPTCKFKDGDAVVAEDSESFQLFLLKHLTHSEDDNDHNGYCYFGWDFQFNSLFEKGNWGFNRLATEEEKAKLFQVIKDNGYKWNEETKTLKKLEDIEDKGNISDGYHTFNELYEYRLLYNAGMFNEFAKQGLYDVHKSKKHSDGTIPFGDENWFIVQAELPTGQISNHYEIKDWELFNVPEKEKANPYDGHTPQDVAKRLRDFLSLKKLIEPKFKAGDEIVNIYRKHLNGDSRSWKIYQITNDKYIFTDGSFIYIQDQNNWVLSTDKFDITTLKPFKSKVLVRNWNSDYWKPAIFGFTEKNKNAPFYVEGGNFFNKCIPYEGNEHLLSTTKDCDEYYKVWE